MRNKLTITVTVEVSEEDLKLLSDTSSIKRVCSLRKILNPILKKKIRKTDYSKSKVLTGNDNYYYDANLILTDEAEK